jgi:hypothetical protein
VILLHNLEDFLDPLDARDVGHVESVGGIEKREQSGPLANDGSKKLVVWVVGFEGAVILREEDGPVQFSLFDVSEPVLEGVVDDADAFLGWESIECLPGNRGRVSVYRHVCGGSSRRCVELVDWGGMGVCVSTRSRQTSKIL